MVYILCVHLAHGSFRETFVKFDRYDASMGPDPVTAALTDEKLSAKEIMAIATCFLDYRFVGVSAMNQAGLGFKDGLVLRHWLP
jgi:hypothetical protein